jgi:hypothetical protein
MSTTCATCQTDLYSHFEASDVISTEYHTFENADVVMCVLELPHGVHVQGKIKQGALTMEEAQAKAYNNALQALSLQNSIVNSFPAQ